MKYKGTQIHFHFLSPFFGNHILQYVNHYYACLIVTTGICERNRVLFVFACFQTLPNGILTVPAFLAQHFACLFFFNSVMLFHDNYWSGFCSVNITIHLSIFQQVLILLLRSCNIQNFLSTDTSF